MPYFNLNKQKEKGSSGSPTEFPSWLLRLFCEVKYITINPTPCMAIMQACMLNERPYIYLSCIF